MTVLPSPSRPKSAQILFFFALTTSSVFARFRVCGGDKKGRSDFVCVLLGASFFLPVCPYRTKKSLAGIKTYPLFCVV